MDDLDRPATPIVGFDFTGDPLLEGEFLPLRQGLTVLYGWNGAGKTRLLRGIRAALLGIADDVEMGMVVCASSSTDTVGWRDGRQRETPISVALALAIASSELADRFGFYASPEGQDAMATAVFQIIDEYIAWKSGDEDPDFTREVRDSQLFLLVPTGTEGHPAWDAWAVADVGSPAAARVRRLLAALDAELDAAPDEDEAAAFENWHAQADPLPLYSIDCNDLTARRRSSPVRPAHFAPIDGRYDDARFNRGLELRGEIDFGVDVRGLADDSHAVTVDHLGSIVATLWEGIDFEGSDLYGSPLLSSPPVTTLPQAIKTLGGLRPSESNHRDPDAPTDGLAELIDSTVIATAEDLTARANSSLLAVLPEPPRATLTLTDPRFRFASPPAIWRFAARESALQYRSDGLRLESLSRAERFWATRAVHEAVYWHRRELVPPREPLRPVLELIDEPESGLHRAAESQMAEALSAEARDPRRIVIAATHSPELLDSPDSHLIEVQRGGGRAGLSSVKSLDRADRESLGRLGLNPSDLLRLRRVILLVEGEHDQTLLEVFLGDRLDRARVHIIPLHGGTKLASTVDSQVLFDFTRAHLVALIDNLRADVVHDVWTRAQETAAQGLVDAAVDIVMTGIPVTEGGWKDNKEEANFIRTWLGRALRSGLDGRITPTGLREADIIEYLPVERVVPGATSWSDLHAQHQAARSARSPAPRDFKTWLTEKHRADFSSAGLQAAAEGVPVPREFAELMDMLEALSADRR